MATDLHEPPATNPTLDSNTSPPRNLTEAVDRLLQSYQVGERNPWSTTLDDKERFTWFKRLAEARGPRYAGCTLASFLISNGSAGKAQDDVLRVLVSLQASMAMAFRSGGGLILYGPQGTGKDHLQFAMLRYAILECGWSAAWRDGMRLQDEIRKAVGDGREPELRDELRKPHILAISDPLPPVGDLNQWNLGFLRDVIDRRYQDLKSTWVTFNGTTIDDLKPILTPPLAARLVDSSIVLQCNWPSNRKAAGAA
jgi:DNA replication protein DnaC